MTHNDSRRTFSAFRLKKDTVKFLQDLKRAFEISFGREFSNDEFINQMSKSISKGDPATWEIFNKLKDTQKELEELAAKQRQTIITKQA